MPGSSACTASASAPCPLPTHEGALEAASGMAAAAGLCDSAGAAAAASDDVACSAGRATGFCSSGSLDACTTTARRGRVVRCTWGRSSGEGRGKQGGWPCAPAGARRCQPLGAARHPRRRCPAARRRSPPVTRCRRRGSLRAERGGGAGEERRLRRRVPPRRRGWGGPHACTRTCPLAEGLHCRCWVVGGVCGWEGVGSGGCRRANRVWRPWEHNVSCGRRLQAELSKMHEQSRQSTRRTWRWENVPLSTETRAYGPIRSRAGHLQGERARRRQLEGLKRAHAMVGPSRCLIVIQGCTHVAASMRADLCKGGLAATASRAAAAHRRRPILRTFRLQGALSWLPYLNKWWTFTASIAVALCCGLSYVFSIWSGVLKDAYGLSQGQLELIASSSNAGGYCGIFSGLVFDALVPHKVGGTNGSSGRGLARLQHTQLSGAASAWLSSGGAPCVEPRHPAAAAAAALCRRSSVPDLCCLWSWWPTRRGTSACGQQPLAASPPPFGSCAPWHLLRPMAAPGAIPPSSSATVRQQGGVPVPPQTGCSPHSHGRHRGLMSVGPPPPPPCSEELSLVPRQRGGRAQSLHRPVGCGGRGTMPPLLFALL